MSTDSPVDMMNRTADIAAIVNAINAVARINGNITMSLNGSWGCGKTFVLERVEEELRKVEKAPGQPQFLVLHYNCWQFDYYDEPLTAIVAALQDQIHQARHLFPKELHETATRALTVGCWAFRSILLGLIRSKIQLPEGFEDKLSDILEDGSDAFEKISELQESTVKFDSLDSFRTAINNTSVALRNLTKHFTVVVVVDEMDRCLPTYAIKVLERLHHLFENAKNCAVLLAVDKKQLDQTVCGIFGDSSCPDHYLQKFIHCSYDLRTTYLTGSFHDKYQDYFELFQKPADPAHKIEMEGFLKTLFDGLDMRTQERLINKAHLLHSMCFMTDNTCLQKPYEMIAFELSLVRFAACEPNSHGNRNRLQKMPFIVQDNRIDVIYRNQMSDFSDYLQHNWGPPLVNFGTPKTRWQLNPQLNRRLAHPLIYWWWILNHSDCKDGYWDVTSPVLISPQDLQKIIDCLRSHW